MVAGEIKLVCFWCVRSDVLLLQALMKHEEDEDGHSEQSFAKVLRKLSEEAEEPMGAYYVYSMDETNN